MVAASRPGSAPGGAGGGVVAVADVAGAVESTASGPRTAAVDAAVAAVVVMAVKTVASVQRLQRNVVGQRAEADHSRWAWASVMLSVCSHSHQQRRHLSVSATWGVLVHSVAGVVPLAGSLSARYSAPGLHLESVLMSVLVLARELGPVHEPEPEPELEPGPGPDFGVVARRISVVPAAPSVHVPLHRLSDFDLGFVPPMPYYTETEPEPFGRASNMVGLYVIVEPGFEPEPEAALE